MSAVATPSRSARAPRAAERSKLAPRPRAFDDRATLEDHILSAWEGLVVEGRCACPVCGGPMAAGSAPAGGACSGCASELS